MGLGRIPKTAFFLTVPIGAEASLTVVNIEAQYINMVAPHGLYTPSMRQSRHTVHASGRCARTETPLIEKQRA